MKEVFLCTFFAKKLQCKRPTFKQPTTPRKKERILRILRMISSSHLLSGSFIIVSSTPPRGGRNVSSSNSISSNNNNNNNNINNNNNNTLLRRRISTKSNKKQRHQNQGRSSKFFVTEAGRRGKAKEDLSSSLKVSWFAFSCNRWNMAARKGRAGKPAEICACHRAQQSGRLRSPL